MPNAETQECIDITQPQEIPEDNFDCMTSTISAEKSSGVPSVFSDKSLASLEPFTSQGESCGHGQNTENAGMDEDKDFEGKEDKHSEVDNDMDIEKDSTNSCHLCNKVFKNPRSIYLHVQSAHKGIRYKCTKCPAKFTRFAKLQQHENKVHKDGGPPTQKCGICGVHLLKSKSSLLVHMKKIHKKSESELERCAAFM